MAIVRYKVDCSALSDEEFEALKTRLVATFDSGRPLNQTKAWSFRVDESDDLRAYRIPDQCPVDRIPENTI